MKCKIQNCWSLKCVVMHLVIIVLHRFMVWTSIETCGNFEYCFWFAYRSVLPWFAPCKYSFRVLKWFIIADSEKKQVTKPNSCCFVFRRFQPETSLHLRATFETCDRPPPVQDGSASGWSVAGPRSRSDDLQCPWWVEAQWPVGCSNTDASTVDSVKLMIKKKWSHPDTDLETNTRTPLPNWTTRAPAEI
jgi:hypothetical protein